jgi:hypothetical protein
MKTHSFIKTLMFFSLCIVLLSGRCKDEQLITIDFNDTIVTDFTIEPTPVGTVFPTTVEIVRDRVLSLQTAIRGKNLDPSKVKTVTLDKYAIKLVSPADRDLSAVTEVKVYLYLDGFGYILAASGNNNNRAVKEFSLTPTQNSVDVTQINTKMLNIANLDNVNLKYKYTYTITKAIDQKGFMQSVYDYTVDFK